MSAHLTCSEPHSCCKNYDKPLGEKNIFSSFIGAGAVQTSILQGLILRIFSKIFFELKKLFQQKLFCVSPLSKANKFKATLTKHITFLEIRIMNRKWYIIVILTSYRASCLFCSIFRAFFRVCVLYKSLYTGETPNCKNIKYMKLCNWTK